jgi:hypothetical protein
MTLTNKYNAIVGYPDCGPRFGGSDLGIYDKANINNSSWANLGHSYENNDYTYNTK